MSSMHLLITAFDVMDFVQYTVRLGVYPDNQNGPPEWSTAVTGRMDGSGVTDPHEWLRDLLVTILEET